MSQANEDRLMMQYDDFTFEELDEVINFIGETPFWQGNCCNISKLRKQISTIQSQMGLVKPKEVSIENEEIVNLLINAWTQLNPVKDYIMDMKMIKQYFEPAAKKMERFFRGRNIFPKQQVGYVFRCLDQNRPRDGKHVEWILTNTKLWNTWMPKYMDE